VNERSRELQRCSRLLAWALTAELAKLRTLRAVVATLLGTVAAAALLAAALAAANDGRGDGIAITLETIPILQIGIILVGVLAASCEYAGGQIHTTLIAVPNRVRAFAAKALAYLVVATVTSAAAVAVALVTARAALSSELAAPPGWAVVGAAGYLVMIGLLALTLTVLLRSLVAPLAGILTVVLIVSPVLRGITEHARWLPDQAGRLLYLPDTDPVLEPGTAALVLLAWTAALTAAALVAFTMRDA
jgi:ABC-2 type transport system permease protein